MAKAKKLKSGSWRVLVYDYTDQEGKRHYKSFTAETKAKAEMLAAQYAATKTQQTRKPQDITVREAIDKYIQLSEVLSPTTLQGYEKIKRFAFKAIMDKHVKDLNDEMMQLAVINEAQRKSEKTNRPISAKTVRNEYALLSSALRHVCKRTFDVKLPSKQKKVKDYPSPEEVLRAIIGSSLELPCMLAIWLSFSMSEIRGLKCSSIRNGYIYIDQVLVDVNGLPTLKENAKVETRLRKHRIPPYIQDLINRSDTYKAYLESGMDGLLVPLNANQIEGRWKRICKKHGLNLNFHGLRHMNASIMLLLNVPEKYAMERGGWKTPHIMKSVYQHTFEAERELVDDRVDNYFNSIMQHKHATQNPGRVEK